MGASILSPIPSPSRLVSETSGCFTDKQPSTSPTSTATSTATSNTRRQASAGVGVSRSTSNVFRSGDYNLPSCMPREHFLTIQKQDYQHRDTVPPAGVTTATKKAYSHVLPRCDYNTACPCQLVCMCVHLPSISLCDIQAGCSRPSTECTEADAGR